MKFRNYIITFPDPSLIIYRCYSPSIIPFPYHPHALFNTPYSLLSSLQFGLEGELNDVRPTGSPVIEWYYEMGVRWVPKDVTTSSELAAEKIGSTVNKVLAQNYLSTNVVRISQYYLY